MTNTLKFLPRNSSEGVSWTLFSGLSLLSCSVNLLTCSVPCSLFKSSYTDRTNPLSYLRYTNFNGIGPPYHLLLHSLWFRPCLIHLGTSDDVLKTWKETPPFSNIPISILSCNTLTSATDNTILIWHNLYWTLRYSLRKCLKCTCTIFCVRFKTWKTVVNFSSL